MKKFLAMLLCVALVASLGVSAFAAGVEGLETTKISAVTKDDITKDAKLAFDYSKIGASTKADIDAVATALKNANADLATAKANLALAQSTMNAAKAAVFAAVKNEFTALQNAYKAIATEEIANAYADAMDNYATEYATALNNIATAVNEAVQSITVEGADATYTIKLTGIVK